MFFWFNVSIFVGLNVFSLFIIDVFINIIVYLGVRNVINSVGSVYLWVGRVYIALNGKNRKVRSYNADSRITRGVLERNPRVIRGFTVFEFFTINYRDITLSIVYFY